jgi:alpha/beta superfamily hydrolase
MKGPVFPRPARMNRPEHVVIEGPAGRLEGALVRAPSPVAAALLLHPHPLYQGTMENKVVTTLARAVERLGGASLRFNFRGVGESDGSYDGGRGEKDDARAAAAWLRSRIPEVPLWIMGFSFGAALAFDLAAELGASFLVTVAPPVGMVAHPDAPPCPWLLVQGDADEVVDPQAVRAWASAITPPPDLVSVPGASHFFHGRLGAIVAAVEDAAHRHGLVGDAGGRGKS